MRKNILYYLLSVNTFIHVNKFRPNMNILGLTNLCIDIEFFASILFAVFYGLFERD